MDLKVVADAIAARFTGLTATNGTATEALAITPTASLPNDLAKGPAILVYHPDGSLGMEMSPHATDTWDFPVRLLRDPLDYPGRSDWLYAWATAMRPRVWQQFTLGITGVTQAAAVAMRVELDGQAYAGKTFDVVELTVRVQTWELATGVSA
jgi:hypothetical protein